MRSYFIESFKITKLWGYRDIDLTFNSDVNILIGPNGSGKTTILNLLYSILSVDLPSLLDVNFDQAEIKLREFEGRSVRTVKVGAVDGFLRLSVGQTKFEVDIDMISDLRFSRPYRHPETGKILRRTLPRRLVRERIVPEKLDDVLTNLVPIVWLPVNRRLPVTEGEEERYTRTDSVESVDLRLRELLEDLSRYHTRLNALLSERYKDFGLHVLSEMLYSKEHDQLKSIRNSMFHSLPTEAEKTQLLRAFKAAGLLNKRMRIRINEHFAAAEEGLKRIRESENIHLDIEDILVLPLIGRTKSMVNSAGELEEDEKRIFAPLRCYEEIVNSFLEGKSVGVDEGGKLKIESYSPSELNPFILSSGEKQILILLTQALLRVDDPVVYIADEPELSLHVLWQEKLLDSLVTLGGEIQVIVATHSPDIVGKFRDKIINLEGTS